MALKIFYLKCFQYILIALCTLFFCSTINAQVKFSSNRISKKITTKGKVNFETRIIVPNSFYVKNYDTSFYTINTNNGTITWLKNIQVDSVEVVYRFFNFNIQTTASRYNYDSVKNNFLVKPAVITKRNNTTDLFGANSSMNYNGSFGRNLSFGNNQDAVFNSQLNLQISGMLGDSIEVAAAITDNNIPIQPDGTTQQLNEFDKILLQFKKKNWQINLGDIDARNNQYYFLNFYKRLQGASYETTNKKGTNKFSMAAAIAKGKFARNIFKGLEGNQGPYRLTGNNNELFMVILAGTERVFINGELLQRGEDQDYIINYNTAEITFTQKRMITREKRIQVEFEYADRNYLNTMLFASNEMQINKKLKISIAAYTNADAKNSPINQQLDAKQKQFLNNVGDSIQNAFYPSAFIDSFSSTKILYAKRVNPVNPLWDSIYVFSTQPDSAKYSLNFVYVGENKGNYAPLLNGVNGKVYEYKPPVNTALQGSYEPAIFLVTPKKQSVVTASAMYNIDSKTVLTTDVALSNYDINTFSTKNKEDNTGYAGKFLLQKITFIKRNVQLNSTLGYEFVDEKFRPIERLRPVEFARDWGLPLLPNYATEHLPQLAFELKNNQNNNSIRYSINGYFRNDGFNAIKNTFFVNHQFIETGIDVKFDGSRADHNTPFDKGYFSKINSEISKTFKALDNYKLAFTYVADRNIQRNKFTDTLTPMTLDYNIIGAYIKSNTAKKNNWFFQYFHRTNNTPFQKQLIELDKSDNFSFTSELFQNNHHKFRFNATYRALYIKNNNTTTNPDKTLLGRAEYLFNEWHGFITGSMLYELGAGQEQQRDFSYVEVPAGKGEYTWIDYNNDGLPQLNEFEIAIFPDQAKYIRIYTPTNKFVKAGYVQFNYTLNITPIAIASKISNKNFKNFITRFSLQSALQTSKKNIANGNPLFNPFKDKNADSALINMQQFASNTISFNRFSSKWGIDLSNLQNTSKALLTYGFESRKNNEWIIRTRVNFKKQYTLELTNKIGSVQLFTPLFLNRNYNIKTLSVEPKISYTYFTKYRLQLSYLYMQKENAIMYGGEKSISNSIIAEGKMNVVNNTSLLAKISINNIQYTGTNNTTVSYIMLDAFLPGKNYLWTIEFTKRLGNNLELNLNYEGRKPADARVIHIGRAGIRALL